MEQGLYMPEATRTLVEVKSNSSAQYQETPEAKVSVWRPKWKKLNDVK